jgi:uncharacterized protein (DUF433 family)
VSIVLDNLADGESRDAILRSYPSLTLEDIRAVIAYAAELAREHVDSPSEQSTSSMRQSL